MLKFNTHTPSELSGFLQSLRAVFINKNQDIRTIGTGKLLHAAGEAQLFSGWQQLCSALEQTDPLAEKLQEDDNTEEVRKNDSALEDIMALCEKEKSGDSYDANDVFYSNSVKTIDVTITLSSSTALIITVDSEGNFLSGRLRSTGMGRGKIAVTELSTDQLDALEPVVQGRVMGALSELDFNWG